MLAVLARSSFVIQVPFKASVTLSLDNSGEFIFPL